MRQRGGGSGRGKGGVGGNGELGQWDKGNQFAVLSTHADQS